MFAPQDLAGADEGRGTFELLDREQAQGVPHQGRDAGTAYAAVIPAYVVVALIFIVINYGLTVLAGRVEQRINRRGRAAGGAITNAMPGAPGGSGAMASTGLAGDNVQNLDPRA